MSSPLPRETFRPGSRQKSPAIYRFFPILLIFSSLSAAQTLQPLSIETGRGEVVCFRVELAADPAARRRGLMYRQQLPAHQGMLFDYKKPQAVQMWMKNTFIPLDMLFIGADGEIVHIVEHARPQSLEIIHSPRPARAVLEVNAGVVDRHDIRVGDRVRHAMFNDETH